jgi:hypothetical protein
LQRRLKTKILLTATPFQLDPRQWNGLAANIVKSGAKVMRVPVVAKYIEMLSDVFEKGSVEGPPPRLVADASSVMRKIAARTVCSTAWSQIRTMSACSTNLSPAIAGTEFSSASRRRG